MISPGLVERENSLWQSLSNQSQIDLLGLPKLQKAYLGLSGVSYRTALSATPRLRIDEVDVTGRTNLSWASWKGDDTTVAELLACGADPNITDSLGMSSLHYAAVASSERCLRLLLTSKGVLEAKDRKSNTALALAAMRDGEGVRVLLKFGADMETQTNFGWRPMHRAVLFDCPQNAIHLLHAGADTFAQNSFGRNTLDVAIERNTHSTLRVLLEAQSLSVRPIDSLLSEVDIPTVAWHADQETLEILHSAVLGGFHLKLDSGHETGVDTIGLAKWRRDTNQEWSEIGSCACEADPFAWFQSSELLLRAVKRRKPRISEDVDDEGDSQLDHGTGEESSDTESADGTENEESWEDARESQGEL